MRPLPLFVSTSFLVVVSALAWVLGVSIGGPREGLIGLVVVWTLAPLAIVVPYCRRFCAALSDCVLTASWLGVIYVLPILPFFFAHDGDALGDLFLTMLLLVALWRVMAWSLGRQGLYDETDRPLPELTGERRQVADGVLLDAGLRPLSVRLRPLGSMNALVQGIRHCMVIIDTDASKRLRDGEFRALLAHEAGHVHLGGALPYFAVLPLHLAVVNCLTAADLVDREQGIVPLVTVLFVLMMVCQWVEFFCDRFSASVTSAAETGSMLRRMHEELPDGLRRFASSRWLCVFGIYPPLSARLAAIAQADRRDFTRYVAVVVTVALAVFVAPWALLILAPRRSPGTSETLGGYATFLAFLYPGLWVGALILLRRARRAVERPVGPRMSRRVAFGWVRPALYGSLGLLALAAVLFEHLPQETAMWLLAASSVACLALLVLAAVIGAHRAIKGWVPRRIRRAVAEVTAILTEGKTEEAFRTLEGLSPRDRTFPMIGYLRALCLLYLGRAQDAEEAATAVLNGERDFYEAAQVLVLARLVRGETQGARVRLEDLEDGAAEDGGFWIIRGSIAQEEGDLEEADRCYSRALEIAPRDARALAGRALAAMEREGATELARECIDKVDPADRDDPTVLLTEARWAQLRGRNDDAEDLFRRSLEKLQELGRGGYGPLYERRARRWGIPVRS